MEKTTRENLEEMIADLIALLDSLSEEVKYMQIGSVLQDHINNLKEKILPCTLIAEPLEHMRDILSAQPNLSREELEKELDKKMGSVDNGGFAIPRAVDWIYELNKEFLEGLRENGLLKDPES